jgi:hypothetical protein
MAARRQAQPAGVIETLSAGYVALNRQLWVLLLPILLDAFLWLGPHVSYSPLVAPVVTHASELARQLASGPLRLYSPDPSALTVVDQTRQWLIAQSDDVNGLSALSWGPTAVPSVGPTSPGDDVSFVQSWPDGLGLLLACMALSLVLGGWYYGGLAGAVRGQSDGVLNAGRDVPRAILAVLGLVLVLCGAALVLGLPVLPLIVFMAQVAQPVAIFGALAFVGAALFAAIHLFFAIDAIFVSGVGPLAAIQRSVVVVRRNPLPSLGLILLTWLILLGMARFWDVLAVTVQSPFGVVLGILGNAYVASGLIAAGMIFYTQRTSDLAEH